MAIKSLSEKPRTDKIEIDLSGPQGNAFYLLGTAASFASQIGKSEKEKDAILNDMKSGDYDHLLEVFDEHFGDFFILWKP